MAAGDYIPNYFFFTNSQIHYHGQQKSIMVEKGKLKEIMIFVVSCEKMGSGSKSIINRMYLHNTNN